MIVRLFRSQYLFQYVLLFVLTVVLWADALLSPEKLISGNGFNNFDAVNRFVVSYPLVAIVISIVILYLQAIILNGIAENNRLTERNQLTTAAIYILMMSSQPQMVQPNIFLIVNLLLILLLYMVLKTYGTQEPLSDIFDAGLLVGLMSLLFFPATAFIFFVLFSLLTFQHFRWRSWLVAIIGLLTPYAFVATYYFWFDEFQIKLHDLIQGITFRLPDFTEISSSIFVIYALFLLILLMGLGKIIRFSSDNTVDIRRKTRIVLWMLLFGMLTTFFSDHNIITHAYFEIIPVVLFLSIYVSRVKKAFTLELLFFIIFIAIVVFRLLNLY